MSFWDAELILTIPTDSIKGSGEYKLSWPYDSKSITGEEVLASLLDIFDNRKFTVEYKVTQTAKGYIPLNSMQRKTS